MGKKDELEWDSKRVHGCACLYCSQKFNSLKKWMPAIGPTKYAERDLKDGELQYYQDVPGQPRRRWLGTPGCQATTVTVPLTSSSVAAFAPPGGSTCVRCKITNEYAAPNQKDGTYVCYSCR